MHGHGSDFWQASADRAIPLDRPRLLAIINATPDSFYESSRVLTPEAALDRAHAALEEGADALDIGGESTRPGARRVEAGEQINRVVPLIHAIRTARGPLAHIPISIDTTRAEVASAAIDAGADAINDVSAGLESEDRMLDLAARCGAGVVLMHRSQPPDEDSYSDQYTTPPAYSDVVGEVTEFLRERIKAALARGVVGQAIVLDPGLGFGKTVEQNLELVRRTGELLALAHPVLGAASRKSFVGRVSLPHLAQSDPADRLAGSLAFSIEQLHRGVRLFRVHDVRAHREALDAAWTIGTGRVRSD